jgi:hypothetical protein
MNGSWRELGKGTGIEKGTERKVRPKHGGHYLDLAMALEEQMIFGMSSATKDCVKPMAKRSLGCHEDVPKTHGSIASHTSNVLY